MGEGLIKLLVQITSGPRTRHRPIGDWDEVFDYIWDNRQWFAGISLMASTGDKAYPQAPFTQVRTVTEIPDEQPNGAP